MLDHTDEGTICSETSISHGNDLSDLSEVRMYHTQLTQMNFHEIIDTFFKFGGKNSTSGFPGQSGRPIEAFSAASVIMNVCINMTGKKTNNFWKGRMNESQQVLLPGRSQPTVEKTELVIAFVASPGSQNVHGAGREGCLSGAGMVWRRQSFSSLSIFEKTSVPGAN